MMWRCRQSPVTYLHNSSLVSNGLTNFSTLGKIRQRDEWILEAAVEMNRTLGEEEIRPHAHPRK